MSKVIEIEHLFKEYRLGLIGYGTLKEDLQSWWAKARGKEDPNSLLSSEALSRDGNSPDHIIALNDINLIVNRGERLGIIGPNGAGKTTLLKILSRIASPSKGTARIKGRVACLIAVGTGFHHELTGRENIYLNGSILGLRKFEIDQRFDEIVDFSGVEQFIDTPVKRYSSGMHIRLGFAVAAHLDPDVLIVDEVLSVGDAEFQKKALGKMKDVSKGEGRTILFVSHNMQSITSLCDNAILIDKGSIVLEDDSQTVVNKYLKGNSTHLLNKSLEYGELKRDIEVDGSVRFTEFSYLNDKGDSCDYFTKGEKIVIYFKYRVMRYVKSLKIEGALGLDINSSLVVIRHIISATPLESGHEGEIKITIEPDCISIGEFLVRFHLRGKTKWENYDYLSQTNLPNLRIFNRKITAKINQGDIMLELKHSIESY